MVYKQDPMFYMTLDTAALEREPKVLCLESFRNCGSIPNGNPFPIYCTTFDESPMGTLWDLVKSRLPFGTRVSFGGSGLMSPITLEGDPRTHVRPVFYNRPVQVPIHPF